LHELPSGFITNAYDVTSVYGYPGPLASASEDPGFLSRAWNELFRVWKSTGVVSAFTRFNPLLNNNTLVPEGQSRHFFRSPGRTVSIDLTPSNDLQVRGYRKTLRQQINAVRRKGLTTSYDSDWSRKREFVKLYNLTMEQRQAAPGYFITNEWLERFRQTLSRFAHLFSAEIEGQIAASVLCLEFNGVLHAHLAAINDRLIALSPLKILLDDVREWAARRGNHTFHLGGGLGGREDSLFEFKRQFSSRFHAFYIGGWIIDRRKYEFLTKTMIELQGCTSRNQDFFPAYRTPDSYAIAANGRATNIARH